MPSREPIVPLDVLRETARLRVEDTSLRLAAREIGISHQALHRLLKGAEPYGSNLGRLREWYGRETNEVLRLRRELAACRKRLAECEKKLSR